MSQTIDVEKLQEQLIKKLKPSGWADKLSTFIRSEEFTKILIRLHDLKEEGKRFTPPLKEVFRAFEQCPYKDLKVVIIGQDVYPHLGVADGIAFSCSKTGKEQPSLTYVFDQIQKTVYPDQPYERNPDLSRWANQGVLLLNRALTTEVDHIGKHYDIWKGFIAYVIDILSLTHSGLIWVFMGKVAQEMEDLVNEKSHYKFLISHPNSAYHRGGVWDSKEVFVKVNQILKENNNETIQW